MNQKTLLSLALLGFLVGCNWVDGTGRESNSAPVTQITFEDGAAGAAQSFNELDKLILEVNSSDADGVVRGYKWSDKPVAEGKLDQCAGFDGFDMNLAQENLINACADGQDCGISFVQQSGSGETTAVFEASSPKLRAPVGVTYELTATDNDGGVGKQQSTFCLIAINEAPNAVADVFTILEGETLVVTADDRNLLSNDSDDDHISNKPFYVLSEPKSKPSKAAEFSLGEDGGFVYVPGVLDTSAGTVPDTFEYYLSDGVFDDPATASSAVVTIRIVTVDDTPVLLSEVPTQNVVPGVPYELDLNEFFSDPEGQPLNFAIVDGSLPRSGGLTLRPNGILSGVADSIDIGSYTISVVGSDGNSSVSATIMIVVGENKPVVATAIAAQTNEAGVVFVLDVSPNFVDPELQPLEYAVENTFVGTELSMDSETGVLTGRFTTAGNYRIDVSASDGVNIPTRIRFLVRVTSNNTPPVFVGNIPNVPVNQFDTITPISGRFLDPDGDELTFSLSGVIPEGLTFDEDTGEIAGAATEDGVFTGIRIIAEDPAGATISSNPFSIRVIKQTPANSAPEYVSGVQNQRIALGAPITPLLPIFTDADGDALSYAIIGNVLPSGVSINRLTGRVSGIPLVAGDTRGLQILATDPNGASASSDPFWIIVE